MSEYSKKLYGHMMRDDVSLTSAPRNLEYHVLRPQMLERTVKLGNSDKELSRKLSSFTSGHFKRLDRRIPSMKPDIDIETHVSRQVQNKVRDLTPKEIDHIISKAAPRSESNSIDVLRFPSQTTKPKHKFSNTFEVAGKIESDIISKDLDQLTESVENNLVAVDNLIMDLRDKKRKQIVYEHSVTKEYRMPCAQWAEVIEMPLIGHSLVYDIKKPTLYKSPFAEMLRKYAKNDYQQSLSNDSDHDLKPIEDSESDYEAIYNEYRFYPSKSEDDDGRSSHKSLELNKPIARMNLNFLQDNESSANCFEDYVEEIGDVEKNDVKHKSMHIFIQNKTGKLENQQSMSIAEQAEITTAPKAKLPIKSPKPWMSNKASSTKTTRPKSERISDSPRPVVLYSARPPASANASKIKSPHSTSNDTVPVRPKPLSRYFSGRQKGGKNIEDLKAEKAIIFTKMGNTQERTIELLDKIRVALLEVYVPSSTYEKNKRQKNAMEFSVRFSRNFLYPLKGMIDDLRLTKSETLNSATSNEASVRVSAIYTLLHQSLSTYHKQLRFFLLDQVPQKLNYVLDMISATTKICLQKGLFDRNDTIITCLQDRCSKFLEFLKELPVKSHSNRISSGNRSNEQDHKTKSSITGKSPKNYDLKMFMNDLNMYEPKLVPKSQRKHIRKLNDKKGQSITKKPVQAPSNELMSLHIDNISTHIMHTNDDFGNSCNNSSELYLEEPKMPEKLNDVEAKKLQMAELFHEALNKATNKQVCQVLEPMIQTLATSIDNRKNTEKTETTEDIIKAFTTRILNEAQNSKRSEVPHNHKHKRCKVVGTGRTRKGNSTRTRVNHNTSRASKARKQTKLLRQQKANANADIIMPNVSAAAINTVAEAPTKREIPLGIKTTITSLNKKNKIYYDDDNKRHYINNNEHYDYYDDTISLKIVSSNVSSSNGSTSCDGDVDAEEIDSDDKSCASDKVCNSRFTAGDDDHYELHSDENCDMCSSQETFVPAADLQHSSDDDFASKQADDIYSSIKRESSCELQDRDDEARELFWSTINQVNSHDELMLSIPDSSAVPSSRSSLMEVQSHPVPHKPNVEKNNDVNNEPKQQKQKNMRKHRLYSKKKNPLKSPPPAPGVTPSNSARSEKRLEQMEIMRQELQQIYQFPQKQTNTNNNDDITLATAKTPISIFMEPTLKTTATSAKPLRMTSDANMLMMNSIEIPLTNTIEMNANDFSMPKNHNKSEKVKKIHNIERINTLENVIGGAKKIDSNYQSQQYGNQSNNVSAKTKNKQTKITSAKSPYETLQIISRCLQDLPKIHEDKILQKFVEKERKLYKVFEENNMKKLIPDLNEMAERIADMEKQGKETRKRPQVRVERDSVFSKDIDNVKNLVGERNHFLEICNTNRFYSNPSFEQPWNIFSRIANEITQEIVDSVESDFAIGLSKFVNDFLDLETQL